MNKINRGFKPLSFLFKKINQKGVASRLANSLPGSKCGRRLYLSGHFCRLSLPDLSTYIRLSRFVYYMILRGFLSSYFLNSVNKVHIFPYLDHDF